MYLSKNIFYLSIYKYLHICISGLYIVNVLSSEFRKERIRLYRDDGLSCFQNMTGPQAERVKKEIREIFRSCGLKTTIELNLQITDFLDVTFNLKNEKNILLENLAMTHYTSMLSEIIQKTSSKKSLI